MQKVLAKINLSNVLSNANFFLRHAGVPVYAVVKADAYGHGAVPITQALSGVACGFAVSLIEEGLSIKTAACGKDILVFTPPTDKNEAWLLIKNGLVATVASAASARLIDEVSRRSGRSAKVHIKCNTGMNRYGVTLPVLGKICKRFRQNDGVKVEGIYSHLYDHEEATAKEQRLGFIKAQTICRQYFPSVKSHLSATYGALLGKEFSFDAVRIGLGLYGYCPKGIKTPPPLKKALSIYAKCTDERIYREGGVGYSTIAPLVGEPLHTFRCGYADGIPYKGKAMPMQALSHPCMDACIWAGDKRRLVGKWMPVMTDADQAAEGADTISYEIICRATARAEKVYGYDG